MSAAPEQQVVERASFLKQGHASLDQTGGEFL